jgi:hypothetical protein
MKKIILFCFAMAFNLSAVSMSHSKHTWQTPTAPKGDRMFQNNGLLQKWAGEVLEALYDSETLDVARVRISITHITDKSNYYCGQIVDLSVEDIKEFAGYSLALRKCN